MARTHGKHCGKSLHVKALRRLTEDDEESRVTRQSATSHAVPHAGRVTRQTSGKQMGRGTSIIPELKIGANIFDITQNMASGIVADCAANSQTEIAKRHKVVVKWDNTSYPNEAKSLKDIIIHFGDQRRKIKPPAVIYSPDDWNNNRCCTKDDSRDMIPCNKFGKVRQTQSGKVDKDLLDQLGEALDGYYTSSNDLEIADDISDIGSSPIHDDVSLHIVSIFAPHLNYELYQLLRCSHLHSRFQRFFIVKRILGVRRAPNLLVEYKVLFENDATPRMRFYDKLNDAGQEHARELAWRHGYADRFAEFHELLRSPSLSKDDWNYTMNNSAKSCLATIAFSVSKKMRMPYERVSAKNGKHTIINTRNVASDHANSSDHIGFYLPLFIF
jgi:hypothetical protein